MKPVSLEFSGIHSYRERQKIDFEELGCFGLFGIFGPTGSGKSSILDAITLALFGAVDRAPRKTYGIINQLESAAEISFTFELGGQRYTAQRGFERVQGDAENVKTKYARVIKRAATVEGTDEVLADRPATSDECVKELLGFGADDFLRAVVLPQGKFDQFLRLRPNERGEMLENIFGLERFGEELRTKAKQRAEAYSTELSKIEAGQLELGDCSADAIKNARAHAEDLAKDLESAKERLNATEAAYGEQLELKNLYDEMTSALERLEELDVQSKSIDELRTMVERAGKAAPFISQIAQVSQVQSEAQEKRDRLSQLEEKLKEAEDGYHHAQQTLEKERSIEGKEIPNLLHKKNELERALQEKKKLETLTKCYDSRAESLEKIDREIEVETGKKQELDSCLSKLLQEQSDLGLSESEVSVEPLWRETTGRAYQCYLDLKTSIDRVENIERDLLKKKRALTESKSMAIEVFNQIFDISASRYILSDTYELEMSRIVLDDLLLKEGTMGQIPICLGEKSHLDEKDVCYSHGDKFSDPVFWGDMALCVSFDRDYLCQIAENEKKKAESLLKGCRAKKEESLIRHQTSLLARELEDGKPCPVCGSLHHPAPSVSEDSAEIIFVAQTAEELASDCLDAVQTWYANLMGCIQLWDNAVMNQKELLDEFWDEYNRFVCKCTLFLHKAEPILAPDVIGQIYEKLIGDGRTRAYRILREPEVPGVEETLRVLIDGLTDCVHAIEKKDIERQEIREKMDVIRAYIEAIQKKAQGVRDALGRLGEDRGAEIGYLNALQSQITALRESVSNICGERDPEGLLEETVSRIDSIQNDYENAVKVAQSAQEALSKVRLDHQAAKSAQEQVQTSLCSLQRYLAEQLAVAGFESEEEAKAHILSPQDMSRIQGELKDYDGARIEVQARIKDLRDKIDSREFSQEVFEAAMAALEVVRTKENELREQAAVANADLRRLAETRKRWDELEAQRQEMERARAVAFKLLSLVTGRRFVQFLAQEHLKDMIREASITLGSLTGQRYALELSDSLEFVVRDDFNGGERRSVTTLSGGETFLTSLALALALSSNIQLKGKYPLGFFFLDEGFGTLDSTKLDLVMDALERIRDKERMVGVISHVKELKDRLPSYLEVIPAADDGTGSQIKVVGAKK